MLRTFHSFAFYLHEVRALERFKAEVIITEIAVVNDRRVEQVGVLGHDRVHVIGDE